MINHNPSNLTLDDWIADLDAADAEIERGDLVPGEVVFAELEQRLARLEARQNPPTLTQAVTPH